MGLLTLEQISQVLSDKGIADEKAFGDFVDAGLEGVKIAKIGHLQAEKMASAQAYDLQIQNIQNPPKIVKEPLVKGE